MRVPGLALLILLLDVHIHSVLHLVGMDFPYIIRRVYYSICNMVISGHCTCTQSIDFALQDLSCVRDIDKGGLSHSHQVRDIQTTSSVQRMMPHRSSRASTLIVCGGDAQCQGLLSCRETLMLIRASEGEGGPGGSGAGRADSARPSVCQIPMPGGHSDSCFDMVMSVL